MAGTYETACRGKDKHKTYEAAAKQAVKRENGARGSGKKLGAYRCDFCGHYHVGNSDRLRRSPYRRHKYRPR